MQQLDDSVMRDENDSDAFLSKIYQLIDKLSDLGEVVSFERLNTIILDTLPAEK